MRIENAEVIRDKRVLVRLDLDVPFDSAGKISDLSRITAAIPTINLLKDNAVQVVYCGHRGRPEGKPDENLSLAPLVPMLSEYSQDDISFISDARAIIPADTKFALLENLRFYAGEEANDPAFVIELAKFGDVYVNEAFGVAHRAAASTVGIAKALPSYAGLHLAKEVVELSNVLHNPIQPLVVVIGGAKLETKLPVVEVLEETADAVLLGGLLAKEAKQSGRQFGPNVIIADLTADEKDIDQASVDRFTTILSKAQSVVWNGPLGKFEEAENIAGTRKIAQAIIDSGAYSIVGGGDTIAALSALGLVNDFDFVSVGGGAMLEFLSGQPLPALEALQ